MTEVLVRLVVGLTIAVVGGVFRLARLGLWLLGLAGFRGARLAGLAATVAGVWWAAATVGVGPAVRLAAIGWAAWALRHHRATIRQTVAVRRLTAALQQHTDALAATTTPPAAGSTTTTATGDHDVPAVPWLAADQPAARGVVALGRYAEAWVRRHAAPTSEEPR